MLDWIETRCCNFCRTLLIKNLNKLQTLTFQHFIKNKMDDRLGLIDIIKNQRLFPNETKRIFLHFQFFSSDYFPMHPSQLEFLSTENSLYLFCSSLKLSTDYSIIWGDTHEKCIYSNIFGENDIKGIRVHNWASLESLGKNIK